MNDHWQTVGEEGVRFMGKMSASISHELKNVLAIINENNGLLGDLCHMAKRGMDIDPDRLVGIATKVSEQVARADSILKNMNRFAHSSDETSATIDLEQTLAMVVKLATRFAANRMVKLELVPAPAPRQVTCHPLFLENLIWRCLDLAMDQAGEDKTIALDLTGDNDTIAITYSGLTPGFETTSFPGPQEQSLLALLQAQLTCKPTAGQLTLNLPRNAGSQPLTNL